MSDERIELISILSKASALFLFACIMGGFMFITYDSSIERHKQSTILISELIKQCGPK